MNHCKHFLHYSRHVLVPVLFVLSTFSLHAQTRYVDASAFPLLGKSTTHTLSRYDRLIDSLQGKIREPLWILGRNTAGLAIRFRSNSSKICLRWVVRFNNHMNHMTDTGIKGLDLYMLLPDGTWRFARSARPDGKYNETTVIENMTPQDREYLLYLPLYDGIDSLQIGVDTQAKLQLPLLETPVRTKPLVFYGTSILQGGCASRPGMAHTNILERRLNRECINLGFSGNGLLDMEIARMMTEVDASVFILDFVPNASVEQMKESLVPFYRILRNKHPKTPILFVEDPHYPHALFDQKIAREVADKNAMLNAIFNQLKAQGEKNIYLLHSVNMIGNDGEATVDGIHFTDLGMMRYADFLEKELKKLIR